MQISPFKIERYFARYEFSVDYVLCGSDCESMTIEDLLDPFFERHADRFVWQRPKAGSIGFPKLLGEDVEVFCDSLLQTAGVLLLPGTVYDDLGNHFRIGFGRKNLPEAIGRLEDFL